MKAFVRYTALLAVALVLVAVLRPGAAAQGSVTVKLDGVDISQFPDLTAHATVIDENGLPVTGLAADRFELVEDGQASFPPDDVQVTANDKAAVSVLVLVDLGGTMNGKPLEAAKSATASFLEKLLNEGNDPDQAAFIGFGRQVDIKTLTFTDEKREVAFTNDRGRLLNVVNFLEVEPNTGTPLYDAIYRAVKITAQQPGRRAIIVMTDGSDVGSTLKEGDPIDEARRQHIPIFPIGLSNSRLDKTYLKRLAELTGGQFQEAPTPEEVEQKFSDVLAQLKIQYLLAYQSRLPAVDGQYHSLLLRVNTARGQGFDEIKFQLGPAGGATAPAVTPRPGETLAPRPGPTSTPVSGDKAGGLFDGIVQWISQNTLLAVLIVVVALFLLLMLIIFVVLMLRRRSAGPEPAWGADGYGAGQQPDWTPGTAGYPQPGSGVDYSAVPTGAAPTVGAEAASPRTVGTQMAPPALPGIPGPFDRPPVAGAPPVAGTPSGATGAPGERADAAAPAPVAPGGTMLIERGPKLKVMGMLVDRKHSSSRFDVDKRSVTVGRAPGNTIVLDHPTVSRQHATIKLEKGQFCLYDLGSANGTFVGDARVREPITLEDGMVVRFGEREFIFKLVSLE